MTDMNNKTSRDGVHGPGYCGVYDPADPQNAECYHPLVDEGDGTVKGIVLCGLPAEPTTIPLPSGYGVHVRCARGHLTRGMPMRLGDPRRVSS